MALAHWYSSAAPPQAVRADGVVIGSGLGGVAAALALQRRGLRVEVLERRGLAGGASTRNAGFLMRGAADNYAAAIRQFGRQMARLLWTWTEENLAALRTEGIADLPSYRPAPSVLLALEEGEGAELRGSLSMLREDGFAAEWIDRGTDSAWCSRAQPPLGGLVNPGDAAVNPVELLRFLASRLERPVREGLEVIAIEPARGAVQVRTPHAVLLAPRVLICTNAYAPLLLPSLGSLITARRGQMLALGNAGVRLDASYYVNHGYEYFRKAADGAIVVGGCRERFVDLEIGCDDEPTPQVQSAIEDFAAAMFGLDRSRLEILARWAGSMAFTPDGLPLIGPVPGSWPAGSVWFCGGCNGHGMSMAWRMAQAAVASMLDGAANPFPLDRFS